MKHLPTFEEFLNESNNQNLPLEQLINSYPEYNKAFKYASKYLKSTLNKISYTAKDANPIVFNKFEKEFNFKNTDDDNITNIGNFEISFDPKLNVVSMQHEKIQDSEFYLYLA